ncbi:hypothetical protein TorRG33x02_256660 [Trema orientale]|uniref:Uncharacterized protein n=1 Tax=Trema orientale TaxID=63057 RepID=A0A2P5DB53_TREOI|nr:hypothetical protein TorRG33x02_256660 [Trema orientale]
MADGMVVYAFKMRTCKGFHSLLSKGLLALKYISVVGAQILR